MCSHDAPLPLGAQPEMCESGYGLCLRVLNSNGVNLNWLRRRIGVGTTTMLSASLAHQIGPILGIPIDWLQVNLPEAASSRTSTVRCGGQVYTARNHLRIHKPQVCPTCVALKGYCSRLWEPSLSTVCLEHDCYLIDECRTCGTQLRWERRAIDVCDCGAYIGQSSLQVSHRPTAEAAALQRTLEDRLVRTESRDFQPIPGLPAAFAGLSADGLTTAILALGVLPRALAVTPAACRQRNLRSAEVQLLIGRALARLEVASASGLGLSALRDLVADALLRRMLSVFSHPNDRSIAFRLLSEIGLDQPKASMQGSHPSLSQLSLFEEMPGG